MYHNTWEQCAMCAKAEECKSAFPPDGKCPDQGIWLPGKEHAREVTPGYSHTYVCLIESDPMCASIFERWRRGLVVRDDDFLYLRTKALKDKRYPRPTAAFMLISDILEPRLVRLVTDFVSYYEVPRPQVMKAVHIALQFAVDVSNPKIVNASSSQGSDFVRHIIDVMTYFTWMALGIGYIDIEEMDDKEFRATLEREWELLKLYAGELYNFRVIPRMPVSAFARYQTLPRGKREIRRVISNYLVHQAKEYPHLLSPWSTGFTDLAFAKPLREMYAPLVSKFVRMAMENLELDETDPDTIEADLQREAWQCYDDAWREFSFYYAYPGRTDILGKYGVLGFAESAEARRHFDEMMQSQGKNYTSRDLCEIAWPYYIEKRLSAWVFSAYPPMPRGEDLLSLDMPVTRKDDSDEALCLGDTIRAEDGLFGCPEDPPQEDEDGACSDDCPTTKRQFRSFASSAWNQEPTVEGPDGTLYYTIKQMASRHSVSVDQLRNLEKKGGI